MKTIAVIPMHNEEKTIGDIIRRTKKYVDYIIAVDDGSSDRSVIEAEKNGAIVVSHIINMGLGFSLRTGVENAIQKQAGIIVTLDADGQHDPEEIPQLVNALIKDKLDIVIGSRFPKNMPFYKKLGNWGIYKWSKLLFGVSIIDTQSGFRAFTREAYKKLQWKSNRYPVSSEIVMNISKHKLKYKEVTIKTLYVDKFKGTTILDGIRICANMLVWKLIAW